MYLNLKEMFNKYRGKRGIGAFNLHCMEMFPYIVKAAEESNAPVIVQTSKGTAEYLTLDWLVNTAKLYAKKIDICLHLDHCKDIEFIKKAIDAGYSSVMYDGSDLPLEENIKNTNFVVDYAKKKGVSVEGEIGCIGGSEDGIEDTKNLVVYTKVEDAKYFVSNTNIDALAVSIGTVHGQYRGKANINFELLEEIVKEIPNVGLVLHGGTGVSDEDFNRCARKGMMKFNVGTELNKSYIDNVNSDFKAAKPTTSLRGLLKNANNSIYDIVKHRIDVISEI